MPEIRPRPPLGATSIVLIGLSVLALVIAGCAAPGPATVAGPQTDTLSGVVAPAAGPPTAVVIKSPTCSCCGGHEQYMRDGGMEVTSTTQTDMSSVKDRYGVPADMRSCHTTDVAGYFVEGHVPLAAIEKLLSEKPDLDGIALPGMPAGSPGMGGEQTEPLVVYGVRGGVVVGEFGSY